MASSMSIQPLGEDVGLADLEYMGVVAGGLQLVKDGSAPRYTRPPDRLVDTRGESPS